MTVEVIRVQGTSQVRHLERKAEQSEDEVERYEVTTVVSGPNHEKDENNNDSGESPLFTLQCRAESFRPVHFT